MGGAPASSTVTMGSREQNPAHPVVFIVTPTEPSSLAADTMASSTSPAP